MSEKLQINSVVLFVAMSILGLSGLQYRVEIPFFNELSERGYAAFFWGVVLYNLYKRIDNKKQLGLVCAIVFAGIFSAGKIDFKLFFDNTWGILTYLVFPVMMFALLSIGRCLKSDKWFIIGKISFEMYIWHLPCLIIFIAISEFLNCYIYRNLSMLLFGIIVTAFATVMYFAVERRVSLKIRNVEKNTTK